MIAVTVTFLAQIVKSRAPVENERSPLRGMPKSRLVEELCCLKWQESEVSALRTVALRPRFLSRIREAEGDC